MENGDTLVNVCLPLAKHRDARAITGICEYLMTLVMYEDTALLSVEHSPTPLLPAFPVKKLS